MMKFLGQISIVVSASLLLLTVALGSSTAGAARKHCQQPPGSRLAEKNKNGVVWTINNRSADTRAWYGCSYALGKTVRFHLPKDVLASLPFGPNDPELGVTFSDARSVRSIGRWHAKLANWEVIEGCNVAQTDPAIFRLSFATGRAKQVEYGLTCDGEEY